MPAEHWIATLLVTKPHAGYTSRIWRLLNISRSATLNTQTILSSNQPVVESPGMTDVASSRGSSPCFTQPGLAYRRVPPSRRRKDEFDCRKATQLALLQIRATTSALRSLPRCNRVDSLICILSTSRFPNKIILRARYVREAFSDLSQRTSAHLPRASPAQTGLLPAKVTLLQDIPSVYFTCRSGAFSRGPQRNSCGTVLTSTNGFIRGLSTAGGTLATVCAPSVTVC